MDVRDHKRKIGEDKDMVIIWPTPENKKILKVTKDFQMNKVNPKMKRSRRDFQKTNDDHK